MGFHRLSIIGRLVGEPRINTFGNGGKVAKIGLPVDFTRRKKNPETGEWEGDSFIIDVDCFNRENGQQLADVVEKYLHKGSQVYVEGRLKPNEYTDRNGVKVSKPVMVADVLQMLDRPTDGSSGEGGMRSAGMASRPSTAAPAHTPARTTYDDDSGPPNGGHQEEEIPF